MSTEGLTEAMEKTKETPPKVRVGSRGEAPPSSLWGARFADVCLIVLFLTLTCLLGSFPLKDADIYWHLRTGDLIRESGQVPRTDIFTFTCAKASRNRPSTGFSRSGLAGFINRVGSSGSTWRSAPSATAVALLISARRREWPVWVVVLAWLPALFVLGGRIMSAPKRSRCFTCQFSLRSFCVGTGFPAFRGCYPSCKSPGLIPTDCLCSGRSLSVLRWSTRRCDLGFLGLRDGNGGELCSPQA